MNLASFRTWRTRLLRLRSYSERPWFYPAALLLLGLTVYGYALSGLGYYWDDWEVVFLLNARNLPLLYGYFAFDRPFAWSYELMYAAFGLNPIAWHLATLVLRCAGIYFLYLSLRLVWPRHDAYLRWLGALLLVYPGFLQQSISTAYNRHFTSFFLFGLSVYLMALAVKKPRKAWFFLPFSWLLAFVQVFTIEYFVGLELIRPLLLVLLVAAGGSRIRVKAIGKAFLLSVPYLLLLGFYFWWRLIVFPSTISRTNYAGDFKLLEDFNSSFLSGVLAVLTRAFLDLIYSTVQVWLSVITGSGTLTFQGKIAWFAFGAGILLSVLFAFFNDLGAESESGPPERAISLSLFGLYAFLVSALPIWVTSRQVSGTGRWDDRFSLAPMLGAGIVTTALVMWLMRARYHRVLLGLLLTLSIATQILTVNKYRLDWDVQRAYYWQLAWRVPALLPQTAVFSFEQPSASIPGYDASFAMNVLFNGKVIDGALPYWFFTNDRFLNFDFVPGKAISYRDRNLRFSGNTSEAISLVHQGENRCLQVLDTAYAGEPFYVQNQEQLLGVSNVARILPAAGSAQASSGVFGSEPTHTWCYYYEKADLARQFQDWDRILLLDKQARAAGFTPGFGPEFVPFIEAYARTGDWQKALELSRAAEAVVKEMDPLLCSTWDRLSSAAAADVKVVQAARQEFLCARR